MDIYTVEPTEETPRVLLDPVSGKLEFSGNSYPENSTKFYSPIINWLKSYIQEKIKQNLIIDFQFDYFNTSSAKYILEILRHVQEHHNSGNECLVRWYYLEDDTDMLEAGEDYQSTIQVPFNIIERVDA